MSKDTIDSENEDVSSLNSSDSAAGPALPAGVLRPPGRTWAGEELEMDHCREHDEDASDKGKKTYAAVDISQFQNKVVGEGYQAKHVVRQRSAMPDKNSMAIMDLTKEKKDRKKKKHRRHGSDSSGEEDDDKKILKRGRSEMPKRKEEERSQENEYLKLQAMRDFRRELEKLINSCESG